MEEFQQDNSMALVVLETLFLAKVLHIAVLLVPSKVLVALGTHFSALDVVWVLPLAFQMLVRLGHPLVWGVFTD